METLTRSRCTELDVKQMHDAKFSHVRPSQVFVYETRGRLTH